MQKYDEQQYLLAILQSIKYLMIFVFVISVLFIGILLKEAGVITLKRPTQVKKPIDMALSDALIDVKKDDFWQPLDIASIQDPEQKDLVMYGRDLIQNTSKYFGPKGNISSTTNGMNCQNCHLNAGTTVFGNNYGSVASLYPKMRARSGSLETIPKRINDCFERSLNGLPLDTNSREMSAIVAYMQFLGENVGKGNKAKGSGLKKLEFLNRAVDVQKGNDVYISKCASCHMANGEGLLAEEATHYIYPPLWGKHSYNDAAGLYRITNFAMYVKYNMPLGSTHDAPQLSDEEAWDVAGYINAQPRPHKNVPKDWPDISKKPIDHPFGPYADNFSENEHKFGPYEPIQAFYNGKSKQK